MYTRGGLFFPDPILETKLTPFEAIDQYICDEHYYSSMKKILQSEATDLILQDGELLYKLCQQMFFSPYKYQTQDKANDYTLTFFYLLATRILSFIDTQDKMEAFLCHIAFREILLEKTFEMILELNNVKLFNFFLAALNKLKLHTSYDYFDPRIPHKPFKKYVFDKSLKEPESTAIPAPPLYLVLNKETLRHLLFGNLDEKAYFNPLQIIEKTKNLELLCAYKNALIEWFDGLNDPDYTALSILKLQAQSFLASPRETHESADNTVLTYIKLLANEEGIMDLESIDWEVAAKKDRQKIHFDQFSNALGLGLFTPNEPEHSTRTFGGFISNTPSLKLKA